jgi:UDPglucose--hexose-1-phosphate uridylyltransferase
MRTLNPKEHPHRRYNPLTGEWVLVSPHRTKRPWLGQIEKVLLEGRPRYDPGCYLCPGNGRAGGLKNPEYKNTYVFTNDYSALLPKTPSIEDDKNQLFRLKDVEGTCRVMCFSPRHDLTLAEMAVNDISKVIEMWSTQVTELGKTYRWVQVFENKGSIMGASNPHPHGQVWAGDFLPNEPRKEDLKQEAYFTTNDQPLLVRYADEETSTGTRTVVENSSWIAVVPYWAVWPFETLLLPRRHILHLIDLTSEERDSLGGILKILLVKYDNLFETSFPYSMGWHGTPLGEFGSQTHWQLHAHFYPPLLRSATVKKHMVGYEMLAESQRDLTPEQAAERLRNTSDIHYNNRK